MATNAGGPRCLKYGVTSDYVLGLEVVLPDGTITRVGSRTHKNKTGFDFPRFFTGTEGLLCVVTEVTLKLLTIAAVSRGVVRGHDVHCCCGQGVAAAFLRRAFSPARWRLRMNLPSRRLRNALVVGGCPDVAGI